MPRNIIEFKDVTRKYQDGTLSLDNVSLEIPEGEFVFLIGASGAGKTTFMRQIVREDVPTSGKVIVDDEDVAKIKEKDVPNLRRKIGYVFQDFKLLDSKNAFENVSLSLEVVGKSEDEIKTIIPNLMHLVGLGDKMEKFPKSLSGGEKQRLAIARALAHEPKILLADEPTGNLDKAASWIIVDLMKKINDWGTTIIFGTHDSDIVNTLKKRVIHLDRGRVVRDEKGGRYE
jgi:cell division transport system ATP-binding protein